MKHTSEHLFDYVGDSSQNALLVTFHPPWGMDECSFSLHRCGCEGGVTVRMTATQLANLCDQIEGAQREMTEYLSKKAGEVEEAAVRG